MIKEMLNWISSFDWSVITSSSPDAAGWTAIFTAILTISTIGLWIVTNKAANAAKTAAEALPILERAYTFFTSATSEEIEKYIAEDDEKVEYYNVTIKYTYANNGRTPAIIKSLKFGAKYIEKRFPQKSDVIIGGDLPADIVVTDKRGDISGTVHFQISGIEIQKAKHTVGHIFFWGEIGYEDVFDRYHTTGLCCQWHFRQSRFVISKSKELNYRT